MAAFLAVIVRNRRNRRNREFQARLTMDRVRDMDFVSRYRLDRTGAERLLLLVGQDLFNSSRGGQTISPETQLLVSLRFLAKGPFYSELADTHGVSRSSVCRILHTFISCVNRHLDNIRFPENRNEISMLKRNFYINCHLPNVVGAIDGTLIPIIAPTKDEHVYVCRKGYHAINCQAVVDTNMRFLDVVARWPGSSHDAGIFDNSSVKDRLEQTENVVILGDSGYPLRPYLLTPIMNTTTANEERYNRRHKHGRVVVERTFGVLKMRFRCLHKTGGCLPFTPAKCASIFVACCKLHNFCMDSGQDVSDDDDVPEDDDYVEMQPVPADRRGMQIREAYVNM